MATTLKYVIGSVTTVMDTNLNALASNAVAISSAYDNTQGQTGDGYVLCDLELYIGFAVAPAANSGIPVWFLGCVDGTNYEDGGPPARAPDAVFPLKIQTAYQRIVRRVVLPAGLMKFYLKNDATGQAWAATLNTLRVKPVTYQAV